jgi:hypothetical protein
MSDWFGIDSGRALPICAIDLEGVQELLKVMIHEKDVLLEMYSTKESNDNNNIRIKELCNERELLIQKLKSWQEDPSSDELEK